MRLRVGPNGAKRRAATGNQWVDSVLVLSLAGVEARAFVDDRGGLSLEIARLGVEGDRRVVLGGAGRGSTARVGLGVGLDKLLLEVLKYDPCRNI